MVVVVVAHVEQRLMLAREVVARVADVVPVPDVAVRKLLTMRVRLQLPALGRRATGRTATGSSIPITTPATSRRGEC